ncbi:uncharacterized protein LOC122026482 [Zingiber officinale]|uniref:uncharacterized protein LOC122026482 n=1 Tax=Zingiber officinale TaxID=94328 RepID=UPI001C4DB3AD|nr:uncharacterized protein LOC122026482 [Zingiber officinale]
MARHLRPYFLAHPITVLTNSTMGKALTNVEVVGRLIKWATELGEYNIIYLLRTAIKEQALADFLTEVHQTDSEETWKIYIGGSATRQGSDVGILLISPQEDVLQLVVRLNFRATNNEAEYEALLADLQATKHVGAARVIIYSDSQLVTQQVAGNFEINSDKLQVYQEAYGKMKQEFKEVTVSKIPRSENGRADELAKMTSSLTTTWVLDKSITQTFLIAQIDLQSNMDGVIDWRASMIRYLQQGTLPIDLEQARLVRKKAHAYTMVGYQLYKRAFSRPLLKCINIEEADQVLREMHLGCCGSHAGGRTLSRNVLLAGYFWATIQRDAQQLMNTCLSCQKHQNLMHTPTSVLKTSIVSFPFDQWSMNIVGPFPMTSGQRRFLLVAVDYFSKWVEAEALARITEGSIIQFLWRNILCRFGIPYKLVSYNGRQFQGQKIHAWCQGFGITQSFTFVAYPQSNGQTEVINREIVRGLKIKLEHVGGD